MKTKKIVVALLLAVVLVVIAGALGIHYAREQMVIDSAARTAVLMERHGK
jgi:hypothetical protein